MPAMHQLLQEEEIRDLVAYLATLKKAPSSKKPLAQEPKRYHPSFVPNQSDMADETTPTTAPAETASATPALPAGVDQAFWDLGKKQYDTPGSCITCHQPTGAGLSGAFPPLAESEWVTGPVENLIRIQLRGLSGPIEVKGITYNNVMAPMASQTDEQVAAVLTYIRNSFGNEASAVTPEMVAKYRDEVGQPMLTVADLIDPKEAAATPNNDASASGDASSTELAPAVTAEMPNASTYSTFPQALFAIIFLVIVAIAAGKFIFGKKES